MFSQSLFVQILLPHIDSMMEDISDMACSYTALTIMAVLSKSNPEKFVDKLDEMTSIAESIPHSTNQTAVIICNVGLMNQVCLFSLQKKNYNCVCYKALKRVVPAMPFQVHNILVFLMKFKYFTCRFCYHYQQAMLKCTGKS